MPKFTLPEGISLHYEVVGPPLVKKDVHTFVFVHGGPGILDARSYRYWDQFSSDAIRVLYIDQRGSGRSEDPKDLSTLNIRQHAMDIHEFCKKFNLGKITIGGVSQGGYVSIAYAALFADKTAGLIVCDAEAKRDTAVRVDAYRKSLVKFFGQSSEEAERLAALVAKNDVSWDEEEYAELGKFYSKAGENFVLVRHDRTLRKFFCEEFGLFDLTPELSKITCDVLYMLGEYDCVHPPVSARRTRDGMTRVSSMAYYEIEDAGDPAYADKPLEVKSLVDNFLLLILNKSSLSSSDVAPASSPTEKAAGENNDSFFRPSL